MQTPARSKATPFRILAVVILALLLAWGHFDYPQSLAEAQFLSKLKLAASETVQQLNFTDLMPDDWELVCRSHGYDGSLYLEKYKKTFPAVGAPQDGAWGLIFIKSDGSYSPVSGSCRQGININFSGDTCFPRGEGILTREKTAGNGNCRSFSAGSITGS